MKIKCFGCSFLSGEELNRPDRAWPHIIANELGADFENHAYPGVGNFYIGQSIIANCEPGDYAIIGWTWIDRFDFCSSSDETWQTLRPVLDHEHADYYYRYLHGQYKDMLTSCMTVQSAGHWLASQGIPFFMTYIDDLMFETVDPGWHDPRPVRRLQQTIAPWLHDFQGHNFIQWSRDRGLEVSEKMHPLDAAHAAAADHWLPVIRSQLNENHSHHGLARQRQNHAIGKP